MANETWREFRSGLVVIAPVCLAAMPFGLLYGALAVQKGLSPLEVFLMSALVFAGSAQFVAVEIWREPAPWVLLTATALVINLRHVMMGASLARSMTVFGPVQRYGWLFFMADEIWAMAERRALSGRLTPAFYAGLSLMLYVCWLAWSAIGAQLGALVHDPARFGGDFAFAAIFIALIVSFWQGRQTGLIVLASATTAVTVKHFLGGTSYIIAGGAAGMVVGAALAAIEAWRLPPKVTERAQ